MMETHHHCTKLSSVYQHHCSITNFERFSLVRCRFLVPGNLPVLALTSWVHSSPTVCPVTYTCVLSGFGGYVPGIVPTVFIRIMNDILCIMEYMIYTYTITLNIEVIQRKYGGTFLKIADRSRCVDKTEVGSN